MSSTPPTANPEQGAEDRRSLHKATSDISERLFGREEEGQPDEEPEAQDEVESQPEGELPDDLEASDEEVSDTEDDESGEPEEPTEWATLEELLEAGGADAANLKTTITLDGEQVEVSVAELRQGYQREADYRRKTGELAQRTRQLEVEEKQRLEHIASLGQQAQATAAALEQVVQAAEAGVQQQYQHVDWQRLRHEQPAEYSAMWTEYQQAMANVGGLRQHVQQHVDQSLKAATLAHQTAFAKQQEANRNRLYELMPEWAEESRAKEDGDAMVSYVAKVFPETTQEELRAVDPRVLVCLHKARLYDEMQAQTKELKQQPREKLLRPVPPGSQRQGRPLTAEQSRNLKRGREFRAAQQKLKKSGKLNDAAEALAQKLSL